VLRAARCTLLPSSANASAIAAPMPFDAPVISTHLALKLPLQLTVRRVYENGDIGFCVANWNIAGKAPDGKDVKVGGTSAEVVKKTSGGNWVYVIDSPYGTA
jgi:ketosteroid isomerase-like protein